MNRGIHLVFFALALSLPARAQHIQGPSLGFTPDRSGTSIRPILGIPGASLLGHPLEFETAIHGAVISPRHDYALAVRSSDARVVAIDLTSAEPRLQPIAAGHETPALIALSPSGESAGLYNAAAGSVQTLRGLPSSAEIIREFDTSRIPGRVGAIAVSDDGSLAMAKILDRGLWRFWMLEENGASWPVAADNPSAGVFLPHSRTAVVTEGEAASAFLVVDGGLLPLVSAHGMEPFSSVSTSEDGGQVFLTSAKSGVVVAVDMQTRSLTFTPCGCEPSGLHPLKGASVFRLNEPSGEPVTVLDAGRSQPRIVLIPPAATEAQ